jgi:serine/threonine protein phosphatase PrpC
VTDVNNPIFYNQDEDDTDFGSSESAVVRDEVRNEINARYKVFFFDDQKMETASRPPNLINRQVRDVSLSPVPCSSSASESDGGIWSFLSESKLIQIDGFYSAKSGGLSEDSEPLVVSTVGPIRERLFMGVFDGMGGAGSSVIEGRNGFTEAYRASRITRLECFNYSVEKVVKDVMGLGRAEISGRELSPLLARELKRAAEKLAIGPGSSRIRGTLTKTLPTTLACVDISMKRNSMGEMRVNAQAIWAGDSRAWVLTPSHGLQQLTRDDVDMEDHLEQLRQDPPMTNVVSASVDFMLNDLRHEFSTPCVVIAATDGVSGYVRSPGEVELHILESFFQAEKKGTPVGKILLDRFATLAHDDVSCAIARIGFRSLSAFNQAFSRRRDELRLRYSSLIEDVTNEEFSGLVDNIWAHEKPMYCERVRERKT